MLSEIVTFARYSTTFSRLLRLPSRRSAKPGTAIGAKVRRRNEQPHNVQGRMPGKFVCRSLAEPAHIVVTSMSSSLIEGDVAQAICLLEGCQGV